MASPIHSDRSHVQLWKIQSSALGILQSHPSIGAHLQPVAVDVVRGERLLSLLQPGRAAGGPDRQGCCFHVGTEDQLGGQPEIPGLIRMGPTVGVVPQVNKDLKAHPVLRVQQDDSLQGGPIRAHLPGENRKAQPLDPPHRPAGEGQRAPAPAARVWEPGLLRRRGMLRILDPLQAAGRRARIARPVKTRARSPSISRSIGS